MVRRLYRATLWVLALAILASSFAGILGVASAASPSYTLTGYVDQPGVSAPPVPAGVTVDLVSRATGQVYVTTVVGSGGQFTFTTASTFGGLSPGYWGLQVPAAANASLSGCRPCAVLPVNQLPTYHLYNTTVLTSSAYSTVLGNVSIVPYNATLNGTVTQGGSPVQGAQVKLLAPRYNALVLANNSTNASGMFSMKAPFGSWVLQVTHPSGPSTFSNTSSVTISTRAPPRVNPVLQSFQISGRMLNRTTGSYIPSAGNATLFDPTNGYIYSVPTGAGGYYSFTSYPANFSRGAQTFNIILAAVGYTTSTYAQVVSGPSTVAKNVALGAVSPAALGAFRTTLDFSQLNVSTGRGNLSVSTVASLGNETVLPSLPNVTVGQLWAQLGLDFNHALTFPAADLPALERWVNSTGPFFPAVQALTTVNGTGFVAPTGPQNVASWSSTCATTCGLASSSNLTYSWAATYALNGTVPRNPSSYVISFHFAHPSTSTEVYNYTVALPAGYVLSAGATPPARTQLVPAGPGGTWTKFTMVSLPSATSSATASFTAVRVANLTAIVNVSVQNFTFSSANVLNSSHGGYTVVVGKGQNVTFSAANSIYPSGTNGTKFVWNFGDTHSATVTTITTNHTYSVATGAYTDNGTLTVTSSGGRTNTTTFKVWVVTSTPTAKIVSNATAAQMKSVSGIPYLLVKWGTTLQFNATASTVASPNVLSVASYRLHAHSFNQTANFSVAQGAKFGANWTVQFNGAGLYLTSGNVSGHAVAFKGWQYNLTLTVWTGTGTTATASLVVLVNDTQKPVPSFQILNSAGGVVSGSGIVEGPNGTAQIRLNAAASSDPNNGSIVKFVWKITNKGNASINLNKTQTTVKPYPEFNLTPLSTPYKINLTVTDRANNSAFSVQSLTVSPNTTVRPIMEARNLTGPTSLTAGTTYTFWVNVTVGGGTLATAKNVQVTFYTLSPSGVGSKSVIAGSPGSVQFFNYTANGATVYPTANATGTVVALPYNSTMRAVVSWDPSSSGNYILYANVTATNEYPGNQGSANIASIALTVHPNPTTQLLEYGGIGAAVVAVIGGLIYVWRRRSRGPSTAKPATGRSGLERGARRDEEDDEP